MENIRKGGPGSGSWEGPGRPRFARTVRQSLEAMGAEQRAAVLKKLIAERYARMKRNPNYKPGVKPAPKDTAGASSKPKGKPEEAEQPKPSGKTRGHVVVKWRMMENEAVADLMKNGDVQDEKQAQGMIRAVAAFSNGKYSEIRKGKGPWAQYAQQVEDFISSAPKWDNSSPLFRGIALNSVSALKAGATIDMKGVSSWSSEKGMADTFALNSREEGYGKHRVIFSLAKTTRAASISHIADVPTEKEVVVSGAVKFAITKVQTLKDAEGDPYYMVDVREVASKAVAGVVFKGEDTLPDDYKPGKTLSVQEKWRIDSGLGIDIDGETVTGNNTEEKAFIEAIISKTMKKLHDKGIEV